MKIDLNKVTGGFSTVVAVLAIFGVGWGSVTGKITDIWKAPLRIATLEERVDSLEKCSAESINVINQIFDYMEMDWQFGRLMTDNDDKDDWYIVTDQGIKYNIDIRNNAENVLLSFVHNMHMVYPIYKDPSDENKYYIIIHDHKYGKDQNLYLYKKE